eukprot:TRINITY_DN23592_c0_g7_i1.p1 TRINITY_DN23592_c0_g7~~TRINITY_DN23592_c0_g7_i1.p1  ORF type:complete len:685 (+),score=106.68 TRINITY_DN23592_c0_g7_i1:24-2057(+)
MAAYGAASESSGGGSKVQREWWWLGGEHRLPVQQAQWTPYEPNVQFHLSASYDAMRMEDRHDGLLLDLGPFTDPPAPYQVWRGSPVEVTNTNEPESLQGKLVIAGYSKAFWEVPKDQLPPPARHGKVVAGFYQVRSDHVERLEVLQRYLSDPQNQPNPLMEPPRRRVVVLIEVERPDFMFSGVDRFRKKRVSAQPAAAAVENDSVPPGEAVFQWWWGDPNPGGVGHWKNYHPHVSARLEKLMAENNAFRQCQEAVPIDEVRYNLQRISREKPFDYSEEQSRGAVFREPWMPHSRVTVDFELFDEEARLTSNCFVQFQRGNPKRRRPVRRVRLGEVAGLSIKTGDPCSICFSDDGFAIGCEQKHVICKSCRWAALRAVVGDVTQTENLVCGCLAITWRAALQGLAKTADESLQELVAKPPENPQEKQEFEMELVQVRRQFLISERVLPQGIFQRKIEEWIELAHKRATEHLYHACSHPGCAMENWILRDDFDKEYRSRGMCHWTCKRGHRNSVLPSQPEINEMNRNLLSHPEHYTTRCGHDSMPLRRFRLCPDCVGEGLMTFAVHEDGCKQWPGSSGAHRHVFCFHCTRRWGVCSHGDSCRDPGIQQVRRVADGSGGEKIEVGFVDAQEYINWIRTGANCPPTWFRNQSQAVLGETRQGLLRLEDRKQLQRMMQEGTT